MFLVHAAYERTRQYVEHDEDEEKLKEIPRCKDKPNIYTHKARDVMVREPENKNPRVAACVRVCV